MGKRTEVFIPNRVWFSLTGACNNRCRWCFRNGSAIDTMMDTDFVLRSARSLSAAGVRYCTLTGGEPTLHPDYLKLIAQLTSDDIFSSCVLITNGRLLANSIPDEWSDNEKVWIGISLHGADSMHYLNNTGSRSGFKQSIHALKELKRRRVRCSANIVLGKENLGRIDDYINLILEIMPNMLCFTLALPSIDDVGYSSNPFELAAVVEDINARCVSTNIRHCFIFSLPWCILPISAVERMTANRQLFFNCPVPHGKVLVVKENGAVTLCTHTAGFELLDANTARRVLTDPGTFLTFWNSAAMHELRCEIDVYRHPRCSNCRFRSVCRGGCPLWWRFYDFSKPISQNSRGDQWTDTALTHA